MIESPTQFLLGIATLAAIWVATRITLTYAHRPDGIITVASTAPVLPDGHTTFPDPNRPGGVVDVRGIPIAPAASPSRPSEKPLWLIWAQMFAVSEVAGMIVVGLLTGWFVW